MTSWDAAIAWDATDIAWDTPTLTVDTFPRVTLMWSPDTGPFEPPNWEPFPSITVGGQTKGRIRASDGIQIRRGRTDELQQFEAGTMSLTIDNRDRYFDPLNASSPYYGLLKPNVPVQIRATFGGTTYGIFTGLVDSWPQIQHQSQRDLVVELSCTDLTKLISARSFRPQYPWVLDDAEASELDVGNLTTDRRPVHPMQTSGARVNDLLEVAGLDGVWVDIDDGDTVLRAGMPDDTETLGDYLDRIARTEQGKFFVQGNGKVTFWSRHHNTNVTPTHAFTDVAGTMRYADLVVDPLDMSLVINEVTWGVDSDQSVTRRDRTSILAHGLVADEQSDLLFADVTEIPYAAEWRVTQYATPKPRVKSMTVVPQSATDVLFPWVLGVELGDCFTVQHQPMRTGTVLTQTVNVESVSHELSAEFWVTTVECSLADTTAYFAFDTATVQVLDADNLLNY